MYKFVFSVCFAVAFLYMASGANLRNGGDVSVHATANVSVPSPDYIIDAVDCLKTALTVYLDPSLALNFYVQLYSAKHPNYTWEAVAEYTAVALNSSVYVECQVGGGQQVQGGQWGAKLYRIFSQE